MYKNNVKKSRGYIYKLEALPGVLGTAENGHLFQGNRGTNAKFLGEQGNINIIGEQGAYENKSNFRFWGEQGEQANLFQANRSPPFSYRTFKSA